MSEPIPTRRAIEVCLSRLPMSEGTRRDLVCSLQAIIRQGDRADPGDPDALRAAIQVAIDDLSGIDPTFPKETIIRRLKDARQRLRDAVAAL